LNYTLEQCDFGGRFEYVNSTISKVSFSWLNMSPEWLVQQAKTNSERKELYDLFVDQITQEIPVANSTC